MIELFKPEDFMKMRIDWPREASEISNAKLSAYIQCLEKVYGDVRLGSYHGRPILWSVDEKPDSTHSVRLIDVERLKNSRS